MDWQIQLAKVQANKHIKPETKPVYCLWFYKIKNQCGYAQMGLMTGDKQEALAMLDLIYNKPITGLHTQEVKKCTA